MEAPTVDALYAAFPVQAHNIEQIHGTPDRVNLNKLIDAIRENAASVYSNKGGGLYGHIGLTMSPADYLVLPNATEFVFTDHPGVLTIPASATTVAAREDIRDTYNRNLYMHLLEQNVTLSLKNIIMSKLDDTTYVTLKDPVLHYRNISVWRLVDHLLTKHGNKTVKMLTENLAAMQADYDISQPSIEGLFIRQDKLQLFALGTPQAIPDGYWILYTLNVIDRSGILHKSIQKWNAETDAYKTIDQFKLDFTKYHESYLKKRDNDTGDRSAYNIQELTNRMELMCAQANAQTERINELTSLAATASDTSVPATISTRSDHEEILSLRSANAALQSRLTHIATTNERTPSSNRKAGTKTGTSSDRVKGVRGNNDRRLIRTDDNRTAKRFANEGYCHTHGYDVADNHHSGSCNYPDRHHNFTATRADTKCGCQLYKRLI